MARYLSDQNKVVGIHESGTYANTSATAFWIGQVTSHSMTDSENPIETRYLGTASRNVDLFDNGPRDVEGTVTFFPQDLRFIWWAIGSLAKTGSTTATGYLLTASELDTDERQSAWTSGTLNPPISFTLEDSKQATGTGANAIRQVKGCVVDSVSLNLTNGEKATIDCNYMGQSVTYKSGTTTSITEDRTRGAYLWSDSTLTMFGSPITTAKSITFEIANNTEMPHYLNGSREPAIPFQQNRDYTLTVSMDLDSTLSKVFYEQYFKGGSLFNASLDLNRDTKGANPGSQHALISFSGCRIIEATLPSEVEGVTEAEFVIRPKTVSGTEYTGSLLNPW